MKHLSSYERRDSIVISARKALASRGFFGTRTQDFAREAGVSCALLFRYFPTLKDIQRAVMERGLKRSPVPWPRNLLRLPPRAALKTAAGILVGSIDRDPDLLRLALYGALAGIPDSAFLLWQDHIRAERCVASLVREWKRKKWISPNKSAAGFARLIVSAWMGEVVVRHVFGLRTTPRSLNQMIEGVAGLLELNIGGEGPDRSRTQGGRVRDSLRPDRKFRKMASSALGRPLKVVALDG